MGMLQKFKRLGVEQFLKILATCFGVPLQLLGLRAFWDSITYSEHLARND